MATQTKTGYEVDGTVVTTLKEVAEILGEKVTKADVEEGGKFAEQVGIVDLTDAEWENEPLKKEVKPSKHPMEQEGVDADEVYTALTEDDMKNLESVDVEDIKATFPEFDNLDEVKEFIKDIDTATLEYMAVGLGLDWNPTYHANIHRMRIAMAIQKYFFPELFQPKESKKKKAKYGDFDTEKLYEMVEENKLDVKRTGNEPIDRMKAITELKKAGVLSE